MANSKAEATQESTEMVRIGIDEIEGHKSYTSRDNEDLTRTGKKPVLKVRDNSPDLLAPPESRQLTYSKAQLRIHVNLGFQLPCIEHLGRSFRVRITTVVACNRALLMCPRLLGVTLKR